MFRRAALALALSLAPASQLLAGETNSVEGVSLGGKLTVDVTGVASGGERRGARLLGNLDLIAEGDLEQLLSWRGGRVKLHLLSNEGGEPNALAGTLQGIDNIEVDRQRTKLYQAWVEQSLAGDRISLLVGLADLNAEFYQTDASGLLIAPAFGVGSELAATGPNGPSIFPSTALTARLRVTAPNAAYAQAALVNARAGVLGDPDGVSFSTRDGALAIGEVGWTKRGKVALGYWRYTDRQPDIRFGESAAEHPGRVAQGAYFLAEQPFNEGNEQEPQVSLFARIGLSDGNTTPFSGGWQFGTLVTNLLPSRPDAQLSIGMHRGLLSKGYRSAARDLGIETVRSETGFEITYSDQLLPYLSVQPDVQYVRRPAGNPAVDDAVVLGLRLIFAFPN